MSARIPILVGLVPVVALISCGQRDGGTGPQHDGPVIAANVWLMDTLAGVRIDAISDSTYELSLTATAPAFAPGDLIVGTAGGGYLKRIVQLTPGDGIVAILTEDAALTDAVIAGGFQTARHFQITGEPEDDAALLDLTYLAEGVSWTESGLDLSGLVLSSSSVQGVQCSVVVEHGQVTFDPSLDVGATIERGQRQALHGIVGGRLEMDCIVSVRTDGPITCVDSVPLARFTHTTTEYIGGLPVVQTITVGLDARFEVDAHSADRLTYGATGRIDLLLGGRATAQDWLPIWMAQPRFEDYEVVWPGHEDLTFHFIIRPTLQVALYRQPAFDWSADMALSFHGDRTEPRTRRWTLAASTSGHVMVDQLPVDHGLTPWSAALSDPDYAIRAANLPVFDTWELTLGGEGDDEAHAVAALPDGGFIVVGETDSYGNGAADVLALKVDEKGDVVWQQTFGGSESDIGYAVAVTPDGGCVIAGETYSFGGGNRRAYLVKVDAAGNFQWDRRLGITAHARSIAVTPEGGYIITGQGRLKLPNTSGLYLAETDSQGNLLWETTFPDIIIGFSVAPLSPGGYAVSGYCNTFQGPDIALLQVDERGELIWSRSFGGSQPELAASVIAGNDDGIVLLGYSQSYGPSPTTFYMLKTTSGGNIEWRRIFSDPDGEAHNVGRSVTHAQGGGYLVAGRSLSLTGGGLARIYLIRTDNFGNKLWERFYGGAGRLDGQAIAAAPYGGYLVAGWSSVADTADRNVYLLRVDDDGEI